MALGTARTCSSLSSSGVIILIRLGRLPEGESRVPPPLEAARASIVLLSLRTRAGENAHRERPRFRVFGNGSGRRDRERRVCFLKERSVNVERMTKRSEGLTNSLGPIVHFKIQPRIKIRSIGDFPRTCIACVAFPPPRTSSPLARVRTRRTLPSAASSDIGDGQEDPGGARG